MTHEPGASQRSLRLISSRLVRSATPFATRRYEFEPGPPARLGTFSENEGKALKPRPTKRAASRSDLDIVDGPA